MAPCYLMFGVYSIVAVNHYPMKDIVGEVGCHFFEFVEVFGVISFQSVSFYTSLFRYMCIVHPDRMRHWNLTPTVSSQKWIYHSQ